MPLLNKVRNPENKALLTGAGFTKNFGGFLAEEMGDRIFESQYLRKYPSVRRILHKRSNYEDFYEEVLNGDYKDYEKEAAKKAVLEAYEKLDEVIRNFVYRTNDQVNMYKVNYLFDRFAGGTDQVGFCFTLNQDLFVERHFWGNKAHLELPCIHPVPRHKRLLEPQDYVTLPTEQALNNKINNIIHPLNTSNFYYIKLHGSFNWKSSDESQRMVIGPGKEEQIGREPLLKWYNEIFSCILQRQGAKLLVIGYGFGDGHINRVISEAINNQNLRLYIISPEKRVEFIAGLRKCTYGDTLSDKLEQYYPHDLFSIFPGDQSETQAWQDIRKDIWDSP